MLPSHDSWDPTHENFPASKGIIPLLTIAVESSFAEDFDILTTPDPERDRLLE